MVIRERFRRGGGFLFSGVGEEVEVDGEADGGFEFGGRGGCVLEALGCVLVYFMEEWGNDGGGGGVP